MTRAYSSWRRMVRACYHPQDRLYSSVGAKGIGMHRPWRISYQAFLRDMGSPSSGELRRHDETKDFTPGNCYWHGKEED